MLGTALPCPAHRSLARRHSRHFRVWSVTHRRYIRKTKHHRSCDMKKELVPITREYRDLVHKVKINQWPEYTQDEELRSLRHKLADFYWSVMPEEERETIQRRLNWFTAGVVVVALEGFVLLSLILMGWCSLTVSLFLGLGYLGVVFLIDKAGVECGL